jgi:hypothetical protein
MAHSQASKISTRRKMKKPGARPGFSKRQPATLLLRRLLACSKQLFRSDEEALTRAHGRAGRGRLANGACPNHSSSAPTSLIQHAALASGRDVQILIESPPELET